MRCYSEEDGSKFIEAEFKRTVVPSLSEFVGITSCEKAEGEQGNELLSKAGLHVKSWLQELGIKGLRSQMIQEEGLPPLLFTEIEGDIPDKTICFYGHFDKYPAGEGWTANKFSTKAVVEDQKLYGRGSASGSSIYTSALAIRTLQEQKIPLPRIILLTEGGQTSGTSLEKYLLKLKERFGCLDSVFVLDGEIADYQRFWTVKSLQGHVDFQLRIRVLKDGVHSGECSGIVPSTFKIANRLLSRLEDMETGELIDYFQRDVPSTRYEELYENAKEVGLSQFSHLQLTPGMQMASSSVLQILLKKGWKPSLTVKGLSGLPEAAVAGNLMLPEVIIGISLSLPPSFKEEGAEIFIKDLLTKNTPFNCSVEISDFSIRQGWNAASCQHWFEDIINSSSKAIFSAKRHSTSESTRIPFVSLMAETCPKANIIVTGVLGPHSNSEGPNECLNLPYAMKFTGMLASIVAKSSAHYKQCLK